MPSAVVDISQARSRVLGFVPSGWYPTAAFGLPDGRIGRAERKGPRIVSRIRRGRIRWWKWCGTTQGVRNDQYVATMQRGTVQFVDYPGDQKLDEYTREVLANSPYRDEKLDDPGHSGE